MIIISEVFIILFALLFDHQYRYNSNDDAITNTHPYSVIRSVSFFSVSGIVRISPVL